MKSIYRIVIFLLPIMSLLYSCEGEKDIVEINLPHHYKNVYMLGGALNAWDSNNPQAMEKTDDKDVFVYELDLMYSIENELIKFTVNTGDWDQVYYLVPENVEPGKNFLYIKEGISKMKMCSELTGDLLDHFWGVKEGESGRYKLTVNPIDQTLNVELIERIEEPQHYANIYMMGGALNAWDSNNPVVMETTSDPDVFIYELNLMHSAENKLFKFTAGKGDWNKIFYLVPETVETDQSYAYLKEGTNNMIICSEITGDLLDHFWGIEEGKDGRYRLTVNTADMTLSAERIGDI